MRRGNRFVIVVGVVLLWWGLPGMLRAQGMNMGGMMMPTSTGTSMMPTGQLAGASKPKSPDVDPALSVNDTFVSFIDSAVPRNVIGIRFDADYNNRQPMRATYLFPKGAQPNAVGFPLPERRVDTQEFTSYAEYGIVPWFSLFIEAPYRWINPDINSNERGPGDMRYGMRICTWSDDNFIATILFRVYQHSADPERIGNGHWSIEPGLLAAYRLNENWHFEGELRYWIPITADDFAGNILRYGLGISYGQRQASGVWYTPVVEAIGWTVLSGKTMVADSVDNFVIRDARYQTIVNAYVGLRVGYAKNVDLYAGYGHSFTGDFWARETFRIEMRLSY